MMIERGVGALSAASVFYEHLNDVDVYIEDTAAESKKIFSFLLTKAFNYQVRIEQVFPLGGRPAVLKACQQDSGDSARRRVYLIDGDIDHVLNRAAPAHPRLYRLGRYCIECYLGHEDGIVSLIHEEHASKGIDQIQAELNFPAWVSSNAAQLGKLFSAYAVVSDSGLTIPTVSRSVFSMSHENYGYILAERVDLVIAQIREEVDASLGIGAFDAKYDQVIDHCRIHSDDQFIHLVSGKDYVLPLLLKEARRISGAKFTNLSAIIRLSKIADVGDLPQIARLFGP